MHFLRLITALFLLAATAAAQQDLPLTRAMKFISDLRDAAATKPGFTSIKEVNRVYTTPGSAERAVKFSGVVIQSVPRQNYVFVQEGTQQGIQVTLARGVPIPALGDEVEVEANVKFVVANGDTTVAAKTIRVTGHPGVQSPQKPKLAEIRAGKVNRQAVEVEAAVLHAFYRKSGLDAGWWLLLADADGTCLGGIYSFPDGWKPDELIGKRVRFRGIGVSGGEFILRCSTPDEVTVIGPAATGATIAPLTTTKAVRAYGVENARLRQPPVYLRAVTTFVIPEKNRFFVQAGNDGIEVKCRPDVCPEPGDEVLVSGTVGAGTGATYAVAWNVEVLSKAKLAVAKPWNLELLNHNDHWGDYMEVDAVVIHVQTNRQTNSSTFFVVQNGSWLRIGVNFPPPEPKEGWWNARIRARGVLVHDGRLALWCNGGKDFEVISSGVLDPFTVPASTAAVLRKSPLSPSRVHVKGTVLAYDDGWIFLRDETGAIRSDTATHFEPSVTHNVPRNFVRWPAAGIKPGDEIELAGSPMAADAGLRYSLVRLVGNGPVPSAKTVALADAADGKYANDLVTLRGRLVGYTSGFIADSYSPKRWREALQLDDDGDIVEVVLEGATSGSALTKFIQNDLIEVTGIVRPEGGTPACRLRIRTLDDIRSLGPDPSVARKKIIRIGVVASLALAAALAWVWLTRRTVTLRTAQLAAANKQLDVALAQEREIGELKSRFVSLVSHEFRTPLGVTMSAVELLRHYRERLPAEELDQLLGDIHGATVRMSAMMEQVLLLGRAEAGKLGFQKAPIILAELTDKLRDEALSASNGKCPLNYIVENDVSGASGDEALLRHIFSNLLSNAVKYSPDGSPIEFRVARIGKNAVFTVKDNGIGIPQKDQAHLFEAFHRAGNVGEREGTGLGLLIVKRCVELQKGAIVVESAEGKGTTFVVTLPLFD